MVTIEAAANTDTELAHRLTRSKTIGINALWQAGSRVLPMIIAVMLTPKLITLFGPDRWGTFTLVLTFVGAFGVFDLGIGRALTRNVAYSIGSQNMGAIASQVKTGLVALLSLGVLGGVALALLTHTWVASYLKIPAPLVHETQICFYILCLILPLVVVNSGLWGVVSAFQMQKPAAIWGTPLLVLYYVGPLIIFQVTHSLSSVVGWLLVLRLSQTYVCWRLSVSAIPGLAHAEVRFATLRPVLKLSGWMTVSNLIWPLLSYLDRIVIASLISAAACGYYSTSSDLIGRFLFLPGIIGGTAFPAIATSQRSQLGNTSEIIRRSLLAVISVTFPISLVFGLFGKTILTLWIGPEFALHSSLLLRWFAFGLVFLAADTAVAGFIDALGHPKANALFSLCELVLFIPFLAILIKVYGLQGAAIAWFIRVTLDLLLRLAILLKLQPMLKMERKRILFASIAVLAPTSVCLLSLSSLLRPIALSSSLIVYCVVVWTFSLTAHERHRIWHLHRKLTWLVT